MSQVTITDKDREAADALHVKTCTHGYRSWVSCRECKAQAIAQAREEGRREVLAKYLKTLQDVPLGTLRAEYIVAECAMDNDGAVDGALLQEFAAIRARREV